MAPRKKVRFALYDAVRGRRYVKTTFATEEEAEVERKALLKSYPPGHEWHSRLVIKPADGCGARCDKRGLTCNLMAHHEGPHQQVERKSETRTIIHTFAGVH